MRPRSGRIVGLLLLTFVLVSPLQAAMLLKWDVVTDGSIKPPGDRIDLAIAFFPDDKDLTVTVRGFLATPSRGVSSPLPARDLKSGAAVKQWTATLLVPKPANSKPALVSIVVPFAALRLNRGIHRVGYEVTGAHGEKVHFVQPTSLTNLQVTGETRQVMRTPPPPVKLQLQKQPVSAYVLKDDKLRRIEGTVESPEPIFDEMVDKEVRVSIPGAFNHPMFMEAPSSDEPMNEDVALALPPPGAGWSSAEKFLPKHERTMLFATNRNVVDADNLTCARFGSTAADAISYGIAIVNIPLETHKRGNLETPGYWSYPDPKKHFLVESLDPISLERFRQDVKADDVLLYVHGYNTSLEFALLRGSQLLHDLEFPGKGLVFSWPSAGTLRGYNADEEQSAKSVSAMATLLTELRQAGVGRIHVISHSMGNRVFLGGLREWELAQKSKPKDKILGQVMLAAPDVDAATFAALIPSVIRNATRAALYYCPNDGALTASQTLHLNKPVGLGPFFFEGLDTINAEKVDTTYLGHGYYAAARELLLDLRLAITFGQQPDQRRPPLGERTLLLGYPLWTVVPIF